MATHVLLTIDTEMTWRHFAPGAPWLENFERSCEPAGVGISFQLSLLAEHGLKACFFVDPMPALLYGAEPVRRMVEPILAAGQEVQLHLHPFWDGTGGDAEPLFELNGADAERQRDLIDAARALLIAAGAPDPIAFRAGSYAADDATLAAAAGAGLLYDSSFNGSEQPWPCAVSLPRDQNDPVHHCGLIEIPITQIAPRPGALRHLQLCAVSTSEIRQAFTHALASSQQVVTIVSHSFELATRDGLRENRVASGRFLTLCEYLATHRAELPTAHFTDLPALRLGDRTPPLAPSAVRTAGRMAQQLWGNLVYERRL